MKELEVTNLYKGCQSFACVCQLSDPAISLLRVDFFVALQAPSSHDLQLDSDIQLGHRGKGLVRIRARDTLHPSKWAFASWGQQEHAPPIFSRPGARVACQPGMLGPPSMCPRGSASTKGAIDGGVKPPAFFLTWLRHAENAAGNPKLLSGCARLVRAQPGAFDE